MPEKRKKRKNEAKKMKKKKSHWKKKQQNKPAVSFANASASLVNPEISAKTITPKNLLPTNEK
jgi:hypothetical protein